MYSNTLLHYRSSNKSLGGNAVIALIFAEYLNRIFYHATRADVSPDDIPQWAIKLTAIAAVIVITVLCVSAKKLGTRVAVVFTIVKVRCLYLLGLHPDTHRF